MALLTIIGIILTILLSGPIIALTVRSINRLHKRTKWSSKLQVERALITRHDNYAFESWYQTIRVDGSGTAIHSINANLINISSELLPSLSFPIYCDTPHVSSREVKEWVKAEKQRATVEVIDWDSHHSRGRIHIEFQPSIGPGIRLRMQWGYTLPHTFSPGDEYYNWDIASPHYQIGGELKFEKAWKILYVRWEQSIAETQTPPVLEGSTIKWNVLFPKAEQRYTMQFGLDRL